MKVTGREKSPTDTHVSIHNHQFTEWYIPLHIRYDAESGDHTHYM